MQEQEEPGYNRLEEPDGLMRQDGGEDGAAAADGSLTSSMLRMASMMSNASGHEVSASWPDAWEEGIQEVR